MRSLTNNNTNIQIIYYLLIAVYYLQGVFYSNGSPLSISCLLLWVIIDTYYLGLWLQYQAKKDSIGLIILLFWLINFISWLISDKIVHGWFGSVPTLNQFKNCTIALLAYYPMSYWSKSGGVKTIFMFCVLFTGVSVLSYYSVLSKTQILLAKDSVTVNAGYIFISIIPLVCLSMFKKKWLYLFVCVILYYALFSAKRGAIICALFQISILVFYKMKDDWKNKYRFIKIIALILVFTAVAYGGYKMFLQNEYLIHRVELLSMGEDASSETRVFRYADILGKYMNSSGINFLFGYGFNQSVVLSGNYAHNDWLEVLINQGLVGFLLYFSMVVMFISYYIRNRRFMKSEIQCAYICFITIWLVRSFISMCYVSLETFMLIMALAYVESETSKQRLKCKMKALIVL